MAKLGFYRDMINNMGVYWDIDDGDAIYPYFTEGNADINMMY
jgi:hypothetical protein